MALKPLKSQIISGLMVLFAAQICVAEGSLCRVLFTGDHLTKAQRWMGKKFYIDIDIHRTKGSHPQDTRTAVLSYRPHFLSLKNEWVTNIRYTIVGNRLKLEEMFTLPGQRGKGMQNKLVAEILKENPHVESVSASFININRETVVNAIVESGDFVFGMQQSPFYKTLAKFGFSEFSERMKADIPAIQKRIDNPPVSLENFLKFNLQYWIELVRPE